MSIGIMLSAVFIPAVVALVFSLSKQSEIKKSKRMTDNKFVIMMPNILLIVGAVDAFLVSLIVLGGTFFSEEIPHPLLYILGGMFIWTGMYMVIKTILYKVVVEGNKITVYPLFRKSYTFYFSDIVSAVRKVHNNNMQSESILVKTADGKRLNVEDLEVSYKRFSKRIQEEVNSEYLKGF